MKKDTTPVQTERSALETARKVLRTEAAAISRLVDRLDGSFEKAVQLLAATIGRVIVTGMGKSGLVAKKIAATFASTGTPAFFLHPAEAIHGDLGMLVSGDTLVALSYSGETEELLRLLPRVKHLWIPLIAMTGNPQSTLAQASDVVLDVSIEKEACLLNLAPTASTTASLAVGDALAIALQEQKGFQADDFADLHPGGEMGRRLKRVEHLMHTGDRIPAVRVSTPMQEAVEEISRKGFGMTCVVDDAFGLAGVITDGDLRRLIQNRKDWMTCTVAQCMTATPLTVSPGELAIDALEVMESRKVTCLAVVDESNALKGILHVHDLWSIRKTEDRS
jgi:arabinose-5-phosphate isomerase